MENRAMNGFSGNLTGRVTLTVTDEMIEAGVRALAETCPIDVAFPIGGEREAVEAILKAAFERRFES
jgi:hypothetical protein